MSAIGIYRLFASAMLFIIWAAQISTVTSILSPEDPVYNNAILVSFVDRTADKYVGDCLAYAWVQAYNHDHPSNAALITQAEVQNYFNACMSEANNNLASLGYVSSVSAPITVVRKDWNEWVVPTTTVTVDYNFPLVPIGFSSDISYSSSFTTRHRLVVYDTGYVVVGYGRTQYRVVVWNGETNEIEVNGLWPR